MHPDAIVLKFLDAVDTDLAAGGLCDIDSYLRRFPEHSEIVRREYARLQAPETIEAPATNRVIGGRYHVIEPLGSGGFGDVFLARDAILNRRVAIKVLAGPRALHPEWRARLVREAEATSRLVDDGLCPVHDVGMEAGAPFLVMPWIPGQSLAHMIATSASHGAGPVQLGTSTHPRERRNLFLRLVEQIARTLHSVHEAGIIHRDVKPSNIVVRSDGQPVLIDFGLAWLRTVEVDAETLTRSGALGTPAYSPPEVLREGWPTPDPRIDVWSLGVVLVEGLILQRPFHARRGVSLERSILEGALPRIDRSFGRDLQAIVETALARRVEHRYNSALRFAEDLENVRLGRPVTVRPAGRIRRLLGWARTHPRTLGLGISASAITASALTISVVNWVRERERHLVEQSAGMLAESMEDLVEDTEKLAKFGLPIADRVKRTESIIQTIRELREGVGSSIELDRTIAKLSIVAGALQLRLGSVDRGQDQIRLALRILQPLVAEASATDSDRASLAHSLILLGDARSHVSDYGEALRRFQDALAIHQELLREQPGNATRLSDVGFGNLRIGYILSRQLRWEAAHKLTKKALDLLKDSERQAPQNRERPGHTANAMIALAKIARELHRNEEALAWLEQAEDRFDRLCRTFPNNPGAWERRASIAAQRLKLIKDPEKQLALSETWVSFTAKIVRIEPHAPYPQVGACLALQAKARALARLERLDEAQRAGAAALTLIDNVIRDAPDVWVFAHARIGALRELIQILRTAGEPEAAQSRYGDLVEALESNWCEHRSMSALKVLAETLLDSSIANPTDPKRVLQWISAARQELGRLAPPLRELERRARRLLR